MSKWKFVTLDEVCTLEKGKTGLMKAKEGQYPLVATGKDRRSCNSYQFDTKAVCVPLVSSTGHGHASLKYVHYQEGKFALGTILVAVIPKDENILNAQFLYLYLSRLKDTLLVPLMTGAANVTLTVTKLKKVKIPLPPIEEQLRVVSLFNRMDGEHRELIDEIQTQQTLLKKLRQSILQEAIEGKLTTSWREKNPDVESASVLLEKIKAEKNQLIKNKRLKKSKAINNSKTKRVIDIPFNWVWAKGNELFFTTKLAGFEYTKYIKLQNIGEVPVIRAQNVRPFYIKTDNLKYIDMNTSLKLHRCALTKPAILITFIGAGIGDVALFNKKERWHLAPNVAKQENFEGCEKFIDLKYINLLLMSDYGKVEIFKHIKATAQPSLSMGTIRDIDYPLPPLQEQKQIVKKIESLFKLCDRLEEQIESSKESSQKLMQSVLQEAFG
jgi:type I restriction enzyme S subunit